MPNQGQKCWQLSTQMFHWEVWLYWICRFTYYQGNPQLCSCSRGLYFGKNIMFGFIPEVISVLILEIFNWVWFGEVCILYRYHVKVSCNHTVFNEPIVDEFFFFKQTLRHSFHDWLELHDVSIRQLFKYSLHVFEHNILLSFFPRIFFHLIYNMNLDISFSHQHHNILHKEYPFTWLMLCYVISYMCNSL